MQPLGEFLDVAAAVIWRASWQAAVLGAIVLALQLIFGARLSAKWRFALWSVVMLRLLVPVLPASRLSLFNLSPQLHTETALDSVSSSKPLRPPGASGAIGAELRQRGSSAVPLHLSADGRARAARPDVGADRNSGLPYREDATAIRPTWGLVRLASAVWLAGVLIFAGHVALCVLSLRRQARAWRPMDDGPLRILLDECRLRMGVRRTVRLFVTPDDIGPAVAGILRPCLVLPASVIGRLSRESMRHVLLHELAHVRRFDVAVHWLTVAARAIHWFNPVAWLVAARMQTERELACDTAVLGEIGREQRASYGQTLLKLADQLAAPRLLPGMVGAFGSKHRLERRITMIATFEKSVRGWGWAGAVLGAAWTAVGRTGAAEHEQPAQSSKKWDDSKPAISKATNEGTLSGRVVDEDGKPVVGARIWASTDEQGNRIEANSDAGGRFRLGPVAPVYRLRYDLIIDADGFARQYIASGTCSIFPRRDSDLGTIRLDRGRTFTGQVLDVDGKPAPNAKVDCSMYRMAMASSFGEIGPVEVLTTDDQGRFHTPRVPVGKLSLLVRVPGRKLTFVDRAVEPEGEETIEAIRLERDVPIQGAIHDEQGAPIAGAAIIANADGDKTTSDAVGKFTLRGFGPRDHFQLEIRRDGYVFVDRGVNVTEDGLTWFNVNDDTRKKFGPFKDLDVTMKSVAWIEGEAIDAETGERVRIDTVVPAEPGTAPFEQPETGRFRIAYSYPGEYHLIVSAAGYLDTEVVTPGVTELKPISGITVKLKKRTEGSRSEIAAQKVFGRVTRNGRPVKTGWISLWALRGQINAPNAFMLRGRTVEGDPIIYASAPIEKGTYSLDVLFQGTGWYLVVEEPGHAPTQVGPISIIVNEEKEVDVACVEGGSISGWVSGAPRGWQGYLWVVAFNKTGIRAETRVAPNGEFSLERLPPGEYGVKVGHDAFDDEEVPKRPVPPEDWEKPADPWKRAAVVEVRAGEESAEIGLELPD